MENVPQIANKKNREHFQKWIDFLSILGYSSKWEILNSKDYKIPQNRKRCFMVSWLGDYYYDFPPAKPLKLRLKDMLEDKVAAKYYLSDKTVEMFIKHTQKKQAQGCGFKCEATDGEGVGKCISTKAGSRTDDNFVKVSEAKCEQVDELQGSGYNEMTGRNYGSKGKSPIRKLTPQECWRLMDFDDADYEKARNALNRVHYKGRNKSDSQLYKQAGNSIVVNCLLEIFKQMI
jgi:DNA (cytosine-5)-methyltransferase 1